MLVPNILYDIVLIYRYNVASLAGYSMFLQNVGIYLEVYTIL
jgi:hypothetical protein